MKLNREILRLTLPAIVSNITMPLLGLCDTTVSGHLGSEVYIGAIAVGTMMQNVVFWLFGFLRMGTTGMTAQHFGAGNEEECRVTLSRSVLLGVSIGLIILLIQSSLRRFLLMLMGPEGDVRLYAGQYFDICIWGAPAMLATMSVQGWLLGMQTTLLPMIVTVTVNVLNIVMSLVYVFVLDMGFPGVAYGTLTATCCGVFLVAGTAVYRMRGKRVLARWHDVMKADGMVRFFKVNGDIFLRSFCILAVSMTVTAIGARLGALTLAANAVMIQFHVFFSYCMDGFAFTGEALCGRFAGSGREDMLRKSVRLLLMWSAVMVAFFTAAYAFGYREIISFITNDAEVIAVIEQYHIWILLLPALSVMAFIYDGFFIGLTATRRMLVVTLAASLVFLAVCFVHFDSGALRIGLPDNNTMWLGFELYLLTRGALLALQSKRVFSLSVVRPLPE